MMGLYLQHSSENFKTPLIFPHAARLKTQLTGVWPTIDEGWEALIFLLNVPHVKQSLNLINS